MSTTRHCPMFILLAAVTTIANGYTLYPIRPGIRWGITTVVYHINPQGSGLDISQLQPAIQAAFDAWSPYTGITFEYGGVTTAKSNPNDHMNTIFWDTDGSFVKSNEAYAATSPHWNNTDKIDDVDIGFATGSPGSVISAEGTPCSGPAIAFGGVPLVWTIGRQGIAGIPFITSVYYADVQSTATHEIGHFLGLGHSATVNASMSTVNVTPAFFCNTDQRNLKDDDIAGARALYRGPSPNNITFNFTGVATSVVDPLVVFQGVSVGTTITGKWSYDVNAVPSDSDTSGEPLNASYYFTSVQQEISLTFHTADGSKTVAGNGITGDWGLFTGVENWMSGDEIYIVWDRNNRASPLPPVWEFPFPKTTESMRILLWIASPSRVCAGSQTTLLAGVELPSSIDLSQTSDIQCPIDPSRRPRGRHYVEVGTAALSSEVTFSLTSVVRAQ